MAPITLPDLADLRCVNRRSGEYVGPCPNCGGDPRRSSRFHLWTEAQGERPANRFWCRQCGISGRVPPDHGPLPLPAARPLPAAPPAGPTPAHQAHYRAIYAWVAGWAARRLHDPADPAPLAYLRGRGISDALIVAAGLGSTPHDPQLLVDTLGRERPDLVPFLVESGVARPARAGGLETHPNLWGRLVFPYRLGGTVYDLRARGVGGRGYRALSGAYADRGALVPFAADLLPQGAATVIVTEAEIKALVAIAALRAGGLPFPTIGQPGLNVFQASWGELLRTRGVVTVILAYDHRPRLAARLTPEEYWTVRHGLLLQAAGLRVRVVRLPILPGDDHGELDRAVLVDDGASLARRLQHAIPLADYQRSLPRALLQQARLPVPDWAPALAPPRLGAPGALAAPAAAPPPPALALDLPSILAATPADALLSNGWLGDAAPPGLRHLRDLRDLAPPAQARDAELGRLAGADTPLGQILAGVAARCGDPRCAWLRGGALWDELQPALAGWGRGLRAAARAQAERLAARRLRQVALGLLTLLDRPEEAAVERLPGGWAVYDRGVAAEVLAPGRRLLVADPSGLAGPLLRRLAPAAELQLLTAGPAQVVTQLILPPGLVRPPGGPPVGEWVLGPVVRLVQELAGGAASPIGRDTVLGDALGRLGGQEGGRPVVVAPLLHLGAIQRLAWALAGPDGDERIAAEALTVGDADGRQWQVSAPRFADPLRQELALFSAANRARLRLAVAGPGAILCASRPLPGIHAERTIVWPAAADV